MIGGDGVVMMDELDPSGVRLPADGPLDTPPTPPTPPAPSD